MDGGRLQAFEELLSAEYSCIPELGDLGQDRGWARVGSRGSEQSVAIREDFLKQRRTKLKLMFCLEVQNVPSRPDQWQTLSEDEIEVVVSGILVSQFVS